jgi:hypothetical protein
MKLYTEEQVKDLNYWKNNAEDDYLTTPISVLKYISELEKLTPIELPSDEEIEKRAESYCDEVFSTGMLHGASNHTRQGYIQSAKWMKEQILNQTKTNNL